MGVRVGTASPGKTRPRAPPARSRCVCTAAETRSGARGARGVRGSARTAPCHSSDVLPPAWVLLGSRTARATSTARARCGFVPSPSVGLAWRGCRAGVTGRSAESAARSPRGLLPRARSCASAGAGRASTAGRARSSPVRVRPCGRSVVDARSRGSSVVTRAATRRRSADAAPGHPGRWRIVTRARPTRAVRARAGAMKRARASAALATSNVSRFPRVAADASVSSFLWTRAAWSVTATSSSRVATAPERPLEARSELRTRIEPPGSGAGRSPIPSMNPSDRLLQTRARALQCGPHPWCRRLKS
jgi:hypothetical protein